MFIYFSSLLCCPLWLGGLCALQGSAQTQKWECFLVFGNFSLFKTPFPGRSSIPPSFVSFFVFYIFSYLLSKTMGCFSGCLMASAGIQTLFCGIYLAFKCSFDQFVGEKVVYPSYSSAMLAPLSDISYCRKKKKKSINLQHLVLVYPGILEHYFLYLIGV